jgi:hypothetical protein
MHPLGLRLTLLGLAWPLSVTPAGIVPDSLPEAIDALAACRGDDLAAGGAFARAEVSTADEEEVGEEKEGCQDDDADANNCAISYTLGCEAG